MSREVAIKILAPLQGPEASNVRQRFLREAGVLAEVDDPHTITMFDFGQSAGGHLFMVFEYLQSEELSDVIKSGRARHPRIATHILIQLAGALRAAHKLGIYHRDIKPANVLVYEYGDDPFRVKLIDFGIAKDANPDVVRLTRTGRIVGTPRYMAPEQLFGLPIGADCDIYSLGLVGFELLAGRPAVEGTTNKDIMTQQVSDEPFEIGEDLAPPMLRRVLERMLRKDRTQRYQTAAAVLDDLRHALPEARAWALDEDSVETLNVDDSATLVADAPLEDTIVDERPRPTTMPGVQAPASAATLQARQWVNVAIVAAVVVGLGVALWVVTRPAEPEAPDPPLRREVDSLLTTKPEPSAPARAERDAASAQRADAAFEAADGCGSAVEPGVHRDEYSHGTRGWSVYVPQGYSPDERHPVMLMFHRSWVDGMTMLRNTRMRGLADEEGILLVVMDSGDQMPWQDHDEDLDLTMRAIATVRANYCVNPTRLYALGDGAGGGFVEDVACAIPLSAVATTAHGEWKSYAPCTPRTVTPRLRIYGEMDKHVPPDGGSSCVPFTGPYRSAEVINAGWRQRYSCDDAANTWADFEGGGCRKWSCELGAVIQCATTGGHYWPNVEPHAIDLPSCATEDPKPYFPYRDAVRKFFSEEARTLTSEDLDLQRAMLQDW